MKPLPPPEIYEREIQCMPYIKSLNRVAGIVADQTPAKGSVLDLMCGTGYLLGNIGRFRTDLDMAGVDINKGYIAYAKRNYPGVKFELGDVLEWRTRKKFDTVMCTGALHHIPYERQEEVVKKMSRIVKPQGLVIISDCYITDYDTEKQRKLGAARLGYEYLAETIRHPDSTKEVIEAAIDVLHNDVMMKEFKTSMERRQLTFRKFFKELDTVKTWPDSIMQEYGDYVTVLRGVR